MMRRYLCLFCFVLGSYHGFSLPVLNPWEYALTSHPSILSIFNDDPPWSLKCGFLGDYVLNRKLQVNDSSLIADIDQTTLRTHQGLLSFTYEHCFDLYVGLGTSQIKIRTPGSSLNYQFSGPYSVTFAAATFGNNFPVFDPNSPLSIISDASFSYTVGGSANLWNRKNLSLSASGRYFYTRPSISTVFLPFAFQNNRVYNPVLGTGFYAPQAAPSTVYVQNVNCTYQEWQVDLCVAYVLCLAKTLKAIPFLALDCAGVFANFGHATISSTPPLPPSSPLLNPPAPNSILFTPVPFTATLYNLQQQTMLGFTFGTSFVGNDRFSAGIEWRFANENAFAIDFNFNF